MYTGEGGYAEGEAESAGGNGEAGPAVEVIEMANGEVVW